MAMSSLQRQIWLPLLLASAVIHTPTVLAEPSSSATDITPALQPHVQAEYRNAYRQRDAHRHPVETLKFFDVQPDMTVVEIWPGARGWYTEILAPYLHNEGKLYAAHFNADAKVAFFRQARQRFTDWMSQHPERYGKVITTAFNPPDYTDIAPAGTADRVLTFRNVHNWYMRGGGDKRVLAAFQSFFKALKPGGVLGVVDHRLPESRPDSDQEASGYMHQSYVIKMAQKAGFVLEASSEINANTNDTTHHPRGVWTLPPSLRLGDEQRQHYLDIGESDRMTLKFRKPQ